jgi:hypothetical protein
MKIEDRLPAEREIPAERLASRRAQLVAAARAPRERPLVVAGLPAAAALAAAALVLALAWPFGGSGGGGFAGRALAALGDGPVLHVVRVGDWGGTVVDLKGGARRDLPGIDEDWYDAGRNLLRHVSRLGETVEDDMTYRPQRPPADVVGLANRYRDALASGSVRVAERGELDGQSVEWVVVRSENLPDVADNRLHEWTQQVAVAAATYEPVATRETRDGAQIPGSLQRIVKLEYVSEGAAAFGHGGPQPETRGPYAFNPGYGEPMTLEQARAVLPGLAWPGDSVAGLPFAHAGKVQYKSGYDRSTRTWAKEVEGVLLVYGRLTRVPGGDPPFTGPLIQIRESAELPLGPGFGVTPPDGTAYISHGSAFLHTNGVYVSIQAPDADAALAAARAVSAGSAARR